MSASASRWALLWWPVCQVELRRQYKLLGNYLRRDAPLALADLAIFGSADQSTYVAENTHETAYREGARAMWLHMKAMMRLTDADLEALREEQIYERSSASRAGGRAGSDASGPPDPFAGI